MTRGQKAKKTRALTKTPFKGGTNPFVKLLDSSRTNRSAKTKGFFLSYEDVYNLWSIQDGKCALTGVPMDKTMGNPYSMSIDRLDNSVGYLSSNVRLVCKQVNLMKNAMSDEQFCEFVNKLKSCSAC